MGRCRLGALIGFFPRHILIGCIGGVGWFLVATGLEVSARLSGNLEYNLTTLRKLGQADTVFLWLIPLVLAIVLSTMKHWVKHPLTDATFFLSIIAIFYFFVAAIPDLKLPELRAKGWVFEAPEAGVPFYHFYSLYGKSNPQSNGSSSADCLRLWHRWLGSIDIDDTRHVGFDILRDSACSDQRSRSRSDNRRRQRRRRPRASSTWLFKYVIRILWKHTSSSCSNTLDVGGADRCIELSCVHEYRTLHQKRGW